MKEAELYDTLDLLDLVDNTIRWKDTIIAKSACVFNGRTFDSSRTWYIESHYHDENANCHTYLLMGSLAGTIRRISFNLNLEDPIETYFKKVV